MKILLKSWNFLTFSRFPRKSKSQLNTSLQEMNKGYVLPHNHFLPPATFQLDNWGESNRAPQISEFRVLPPCYTLKIPQRYHNPQPATFWSVQYKCFPVYFKKIFRTTLFYKTALSDFFWNASDHILHVA